MKFTVVLIALLSVSSSWASKEKKDEEPKDKREAPIGFPSSGHSSQTLQIQPSQGHDGGQAISIGAGYSVGGAKPSFNFGSPSMSYQLSQQSLSSGGGHPSYQLAPITLQPEHGNLMSSSDLSQLMNQLSHGLSTGAISLQPTEQSYQFGAQAYQGDAQSYQSGAEESATPQFSYGSPKYTLAVPSGTPSYSAGTKGLGQFGSTGPVLFNPSSNSQSIQGQSLTYGASVNSFDTSGLQGLSLGNTGGHSVGVSAGYPLGDAGGLSLGSAGGHSLGGAGPLSLGSLGGHSLSSSRGLSYGGSGGQSLGHSGGLSLGGSSGYSLGGLSLGGASHSFGSSLKPLNGNFGAPGKTSFKPSAFLGSSGDSAHSLSGVSSTYSAPSFSHSYPGGQSHGLSLGSSGHASSFGSSYPGFGSSSSKFGATSYLPPKSEGFGSSLETVSAFSSGNHGHASSPPSTTYGTPSGSYLPSSSPHGSSSSPQHYISSSKYPSISSFGEGSSSYKSPAFHSSHGLSSLSAGPRYSFGGHNSPSSRYNSPKDTQGAYSETSYNTIKYSEELKPHSH